MDEPFHVPQAERYCIMDFTWDKNITTPPGLYVFSIILHSIIASPKWLAGTYISACDISSLRITVAASSAMSAMLLASIVDRIHGKVTPELFRVRMLRLLFSPLHFFFHALYYTESVSTLLVLLMIWFHVRGYTRCAGMFGALSVCTRQFNLVWVWGSAMDVLLSIPPREWITLRTISTLIGHILTGAGSVLFVYLNGSVALGHQQYHGGSLHFCMILYCFSFMLALLGEWVPRLSKWMLVSLPLFSAMGFSTIVHPFLLADNRHLSFYLWRRVLQRDLVRQAAIPLLLSLFVGRILFTTTVNSSPLSPKKGKKNESAGEKSASSESAGENELQKIGLFLICSALTVCFTPLLEFRYFLIPSLLAVLFQPLCSRGREWLGLAQAVVVNSAVLGLFFGRTFEDKEAWGEGAQRIMW